MAVDPLTCLALAGNIIQFIDFTWKLLSESRAIYHSTTGSSDDHVVLGSIVRALHPLVANLTISTTASDQLKEIATTCQEISAKLLKAVDTLEVEGQNNRWKSFVLALKSVWKKDQITQLTVQLEMAQRQLNTHLLFMMSDQQSEVLTMIRDLDGNNKQMGMDQMQTIQDLRTELLVSIKGLDPSTQLAGTTMQKHFLSIKGLKPVDEAAMNNLSQKLTDLSACISNFAQRSRIVASDQAILKSLRFKTMRVRHSNIVDAHPETFEWVFEIQNDPENDIIAFNDWLENQSGLYWIVGKAGSGKSTLMKFLYEDRRTQKLLQKWSAARKLVMAQFFFWNAGTLMQKSQEGLLQSLLYEVLRQCPELLSQVCSSRWLDFGHYGDEPEVWTRTDLLEVLNNLLQQERVPASFCFFIDGLDEYDGDHVELIDLLNRWPVSRHFKLCVSSRPWFIFKDAFGQGIKRHLTLENFTRHDIQLYIRKTFNKNKRFEELNARDSRYTDLIMDIEEKAQGVFLWVFLVVRELSRGFTNADTIPVLQRRLKALPPKLEDYFRHIFSQVEEFYREKTVQSFQVALEAREPLPLMIYSLLFEESDVLSHNTQLKHLKPHEIEFREDEMQRQLDGCCRGLLEAHGNIDISVRYRYVVGFLHRTTRDFLLTKDMQALISSYLGQNFNPRTWLSNAYFYYLKAAPKSLAGTVHVAMELIYYCKAAEVHDKILQVDLLDQVEQIFVSYAELGRTSAKASFTGLIVRGNLLLYVAHRLKRFPDTVHAGNGWLAEALSPGLCKGFVSESEIDPDMVQLLLEHDASPNQEMGKTTVTVWGYLIQKIHQGKLRNIEDHALLQTIDLLLRHGADSDLRIFVIEENKAPREPERAADLHNRWTIGRYKSVWEVLTERFGEKDAEWLRLRV